jgi:CDP-diacylglycerol--serine O-phosphatidyltransferase
MINLLSVADFVSITNSILGFLSIVMIFLGETYLSFSLILLAILADGLDGIIARKTKHSDLGEYMEAMADMISLGIAPSAFVYSNYVNKIIISESIYLHSLLIIVLIVFLSFSIIRLASFHIIREKEFFIGLPASASTIIIIILTYFNIEFTYIIPVIFIMSIAMISNVRFPKPTIRINAIATIFIIFTIIVGDNFDGIIPKLLFLLIILYVLVGPIFLFKKK